MKAYLSVVLAAILITGTASAQSVNFGIKAGLNVSTLHGDNDAEFDSKAGFHAGLLAHIHFTRQFALQPEVIYSGQGAKYSIAGEDFTMKLNYINIPVMFQYMFDNGFRLQAGPQLGFLTSAKTESDDQKLDVKDGLETVDFALGAGVGYVNPKSGLGVDARYNFGLSNINAEGDVKTSNRGFQVGLFYLFKHK